MTYNRLEKNQNIKKSMQTTMLRRSNQVCSVYKVKIDSSRLTKRQEEHLKMLFVEAKWIYNNALSYSETNDIRTYDTKSKSVEVLNKDKEIVIKNLKYIGSQMKQSVIKGIISSIKTLSTRKKKGFKVGKLKYISDYKCLNLKQYGNTYKILSNRRMKIQGVPGKVIVNGLDQFKDIDNIEFANAKILNTPKGYYIAITTYRFKNDIPKKNYIDKEIGIDMGIKNHITLSNGEKFNSTIEETERLKCLQKKLSRQKKGSNNRRKTIHLIQKEYQKITDKKNDVANKIVAELLSYEHIYMQDEQISNWKKTKFGKQIQHSILGRVKAKLINNSRVEVLDRFVPTTRFCPNCHNINKEITLKDRTFICPICGYSEDRDINSAKNMIIMTKIIKNNLPRGPRDVKPVEINTSGDETIVSDSSMIYEAGRLQSLDCN